MIVNHEQILATPGDPIFVACIIHFFHDHFFLPARPLPVPFVGKLARLT